MSDAPLRLAAVERRYRSEAGDLPVLRGADLEIAAGEIVALVAPSGTGKSTLLHLAGLLEQQLYPAVVLRIDGMENDPQRLASALGKVLGGASLPAPVRVGSVGFPAGHWRQYAQALAGPFATLTPVAVRLGYPEA